MSQEDNPDHLQDVLAELEDLEQSIDSPEQHEELEDVRQAVGRIPGSGFVGERIERYTTRDVAESFVGSILISLPMLVEDGVFEIADHFLEPTVAGVPVWLVVNSLFVVVLSWGLLYWTDFRSIHDNRQVFGIIPRRLLGVLLISLVTATFTMTLWGRLDGWSDPTVALARISVIWTAAAFGAALGDILPGEGRGTDISDLPSKLSGEGEGRDGDES
jgi:uncharacterized membrane protein